MRYCPHCRKPTAKPSGNCPHCGKDLDTQPSKEEVGYEEMSGAAFDAEDSEGLELDSGYGMTPEVIETAAPTSKTPAIPSFVDEGDFVETNQDELLEIAKFGPVPQNLFGTVNYVLRVRQRCSELKREAMRVEAGLDQAKAELLVELARLGERARVAGFRNKITAPLMAAVDDCDKSAESASEAINAERRRHAARLAELDQALELVRKRTEEPRLRESKLAGDLGRLDAERKQLDHQLKRIEIEIRNAETLVAKAQNPGPNDDRDALVASAQRAQGKLPALQQERAQLNTKLGRLDSGIAELRGNLDNVRKELSNLKEERSSLLRDRDDEEKLHHDNTDGAVSQSKQAKETMQVRLAEVGRAVRLDHNAPPWAQELYPEIDERAEAYNKLRVSHAQFRDAAQCFDHDAVKKGYMVIAGGAGVVVLAFFGLIALATAL